MTDIHAVPGPYISGEPATYLAIHGGLAQLRLIAEAIEIVDGVLCLNEPELCDEPGADDCFWLEVVALNTVNPASIGAAYMAAIATHN